MNPNDFCKCLSSEKSAYYWDESMKPMFNRAFSGAYPPGSTFKLVTATAIMASGIDPNERVVCHTFGLDNTPVQNVPKLKVPLIYMRQQQPPAILISRSWLPVLVDEALAIWDAI
jgi:cell division protein FtsI/penicillin-binding protein 2